MSPSPSVVTVTLNPAIDQTVSIPGFTPGEVNRVTTSRADAGGKGVNVASFLADLGLHVAATGFLGKDNTEIFDTLFQRKGIEDRFVRIPGATRVDVKIVDETKQQTTDINFPGLTPEPQEVAQLLRQVEKLSAPGRWFVLSGSVPEGLEPDIYARLTRLIRGGGGRVALDTSRQPLRCAIENTPDCVKPNVAELEELIGRALVTPQDIAGAAAWLRHKGVGLVVVSMGSQGALFADGESVLLARAPQVPVKSTVGAGDAMMGGIVYAQVKQLSLPECARLATALGAHAVTRFGAGVDLSRVQAYQEQVIVEPMTLRIADFNSPRMNTDEHG